MELPFSLSELLPIRPNCEIVNEYCVNGMLFELKLSCDCNGLYHARISVADRPVYSFDGIGEESDLDIRWSNFLLNPGLYISSMH